MLPLAVLTVLPSAVAEQPQDWRPVDAATLDQQRGGFTTPDGLALSLGIERLVTINGELVAHTQLQIADLAGMTVAQARETGAALSEVKLIQNGSGNIYEAALSDRTLGGTIIQNTLNDQRIDSATVIRASVNSMDFMNSIHFHGSVSDAIARAAGP